MEQSPFTRRWRRCMKDGAGLAIGIALGVALGGVFNNLAVGIAVGVGIGVVLDGMIARRNRPEQ